MMQVVLPENGGQVRVVQGHELELLTTQGWRLVFTYQETNHTPYNESEQSSNPQHYNGTVQLTRYRPVVTTHFVLHKTENQVIEELNTRIASVQHDAIEARRVREETKKALDDLTKTHEDLKRTSSFDAATHKNVSEERNRFRSSSTKLEGDLAKIRKAIGERAFNEILPPEPPKTT